jgi:alkaline phosphatase D
MRLICFVFLLISCGAVFSQESLLQSGPMVGYSEMREALLWVQTSAPAKVKFAYFEENKPDPQYFTEEITTEKAAAFTAKLIADRLEPGKWYTYELFINNKKINRPYDLKFQTQKLWQWREEPPPFSFVIGSCAYVNETPYDRPGKPYGGDFEIFNAIYKSRPDMMLWLGDNVYLREADWYSRSSILYRYTHTRSLAELQPLLGSVHHYAIWDDHDFGPNNSDRSFRNKHHTLEAFRLFWGNPTFGIDGNPGTTTMFQWADTDFFLLDNRYYRTPNDRTTGERTILGETQIQWLIDALVASAAPFKFVVLGGQFLNVVAKFENYSVYPEERDRIIREITQEHIPGVIFLSGDRHHTEISKLDRPGNYPLYEFTISPLTSGPAPQAVDEPNYLRVPGTFTGERNFAKLDISGPREERVLTVTVYNKDGVELWKQTLHANELK